MSGFADAGLSARVTQPPEAVAALDTLDRRLREAGLPGLSPAAVTPPEPETDLALLARFLRMLMPAAGDTGRLAEQALARFGSFAGLLAAPLQELRGMQGFGPHCLSGIKLLHEAALRLARARMDGTPVLNDPAALMDYLTAVLARERIEQFRILFLDDRDRLLADEAQARGTVNHTPVYPREVARRALELRAAAVVLVHNHPSGDPTPSREDLEMTRQVVAACAVLRVSVRDHLIIGNGRWISFRAERLIG
ncbi:DNA repair protein RadC [Acetobacteraceae bacterium KSS8]|uniref:DNA repair protein RadC n=1 Tax=Endosaccharibacter trunci TaxID=2812733 RepID=A0ABT1W4R7_9PROT|nr:DNA repair protein RadC [Acetobacteraceae bacterium KSS8]